jgi:adenosylmethionine---8-amino-7-oxononanoate aminotransferase
METPISLLSKDKRYLWHPFTQAKLSQTPVLFSQAKGSYLYTENGQAYLDGISSWWVNLHGHCHPFIVDAIIKQLGILEHVLFTDYSHPPAIIYAEKLIECLGHRYAKVFYSDNGSTAVETALKMAFQYWYNQNKQHKTRLLSFKGGYHGDTFGSMAAAGRSSFNKPFWPFLFEVEQIDPPFYGQEEISLKQIKHIASRSDLAGFIFEPLILGAGGMRPYNVEALNSILSLLQKNGILLIADEVMTGFGRTGTLFALEQLSVVPDILCLAKGITGGFMPLAATLCHDRIYKAFYSDEREKALLHGHSYTANPLACAAALASLTLLESDSCMRQRERILQRQSAFAQKWKSHPKLMRIDAIGTVLSMEFHTKTPSYFDPLSQELHSFFHSHRIVLRPLGNILYFMPPYSFKESEIAIVHDAIEKWLEGDHP